MDTDKPTQPDLFGVEQKRKQAVQAVVDKNKADKAAGVKPLPKPLFPDLDEPGDK